ncbi:MAG: PCRF domain-containing protein, partial [Gemmatimonadetes bacterium]|nr:PCRF domain-containing protein [Gemmatimonadota bacterium]
MKPPILDPRLQERLSEAEHRFEALDAELISPEVLRSPERLRKLGRERSRLEEIVGIGRELRQAIQELEGAVELLKDSTDEELQVLAEEECAGLEQRIEKLLLGLREDLIPRDPLSDRAAVVEIRAGTGGDGLFAADLMRMYRRLAERRGWSIELISHSEGIPGSIKAVIFTVRGQGVYGCLRYESGVHRVQRVPKTESQGRIHTSAATVAVLPEAEEGDLQLDPNDLRI